MAKMSKKDISNEQLSRMMAKGFEETVTKNDLKNLATKAELTEIKQELEEIKLKFDHVAHKFEIKDLEKRVAVLERRIGTK